jgi:hypothetical protein
LNGTKEEGNQSTPQVKYVTTAAAMPENIKAAMFPFPKHLLFVSEVETIEGVVVTLLDGLELPLALILVVIASVPKMLAEGFRKVD